MLKSLVSQRKSEGPTGELPHLVVVEEGPVLGNGKVQEGLEVILGLV